MSGLAYHDSDFEASSGPTEFTISDQEFRLFQDLVKHHTGIALSDQKRPLICSRLAKRLRTLTVNSFRDYYTYLTSEAGHRELEHFVNAVTTNKTDFYRERHHFDYLRNEVIASLKERAAKTGQRRIRIWSAACSTGEEPYTIAITLLEALGNRLAWDIRILASDIDTDVLGRAERGIYAMDRTADIPRPLLERFFLRGTRANTDMVQVKKEVRDLITFRRINLLDAPWPIRTTFDCIFCRNVFIYFDKPTQQDLIRRFEQSLKVGGHLFVGHSESLFGMNTGLVFLGNTIHRKQGEAEADHGQ